jgi:hypothetical protein
MEEKWTPIAMNGEENKRIVQRTIAKTLIQNHGDMAHLVALQCMMDTPHQEKDWRVILGLLDELTGESK